MKKLRDYGNSGCVVVKLDLNTYGRYESLPSKLFAAEPTTRPGKFFAHKSVINSSKSLQ